MDKDKRIAELEAQVKSAERHAKGLCEVINQKIDEIDRLKGGIPEAKPGEPLFPGHTGGNVILTEGITPLQEDALTKQQVWDAMAAAIKDTPIPAGRKLIGTCRDCRWWKRNHERYGECGKKIICTWDDFGKVEDWMLDEINFTCDYSHPTYTGPDFGCIHWEGKQ